MRNLYAICHKKDGQVELLGQNVLNFSSDDISFEMLGRVYCDNNSADGEAIASLFREYGANITEHIHGSYIIIFKDSIENKLTVVHDAVSSPLALYYSEDVENIYISTSIKTIYTYCKAPRTLNEDVIDDFLENKFINSNETLIDGLYKLCYSQALIVSGNKYSVEHVKYPETEETDINDVILRYADTLPSNVALSSDFGTNCLLKTISENTTSPANAFCFNTTTSEFYDNVSFYDVSNESSLQNLPDVVWRIEGATANEDLFNEYSFYKFLNENSVKNILSGKCADYIFNKKFHLTDERLKRLGIHGIKYTAADHPFEIGILSDLKKSGIISNSFDVDTLYPFIDNVILNSAKNTEDFDEIKKKYLIHEVYDILSNETDMHFFVHGNELKSFFKIIEKSRWSHKTEKNLFTRIKWKLKASITKKKLFNDVTDISDNHIYNLLKISTYQNLLYLLVFEKLFISGQFDNHFSEDGINIKLKDLF